MTIKQKKKIALSIAAIAWLYAIGVIGGISKGICDIEPGIWRLLAAGAVMSLAAWKAGVFR